MLSLKVLLCNFELNTEIIKLGWLQCSSRLWVRAFWVEKIFTRFLLLLREYLLTVTLSIWQTLHCRSPSAIHKERDQAPPLAYFTCTDIILLHICWFYQNRTEISFAIVSTNTDIEHILSTQGKFLQGLTIYSVWFTFTIENVACLLKQTRVMDNDSLTLLCWQREETQSHSGEQLGRFQRM